MAPTRRDPQTQGNRLRRRSDYTDGWASPTVGQSDRPSANVADRPSELSRNRLLAFDETGVTFRYKDYRRDSATASRS